MNTLMRKILSIKNRRKNRKKVAVIGMGYVGFPLACAIAQNEKYEVYGLDIDHEKIEKIKNRISPVEDRQAEKDIKKVKINATLDPSILKDMKYIVICVPTSIDHKKNLDLTSVKKAAYTIAKNLRKGQIIVLESTVNPGVCEEVVLPILEETGLMGGLDFELVHCPERINPGDKNWNVRNIPRNMGGLTKEGTKKAAYFYRSFINAKVNEMSSLKIVESTKLVENTFRDINLAYVNELAKSFDKLGIDVVEVIQGASNKPFAFMAHFPGCGVGGHCIPVDPYYLIDYAKRNGFGHNLLKTAGRINNSMPKYTVEKLIAKLKGINISPKEAKVGVLGVSYKADIADIRESPALEIIKYLKKIGCDVFVYDPHCPDQSNAELKEILKECVGVIVATSHKEFIKINDWRNVRIVIDGMNCLEGKSIEKAGILYDGIGRGIKKETPEKSLLYENKTSYTSKTKQVIFEKPFVLLGKIGKGLKNEQN